MIRSPFVTVLLVAAVALAIAGASILTVALLLGVAFLAELLVSVARYEPDQPQG